MASNPMQRKARNAFLAGVLITTLILGCVIGVLIWQVSKQKKEEKAIENSKVFVYALAQDVKAGDNVEQMDETGTQLTKIVELKSSEAPATAIHKKEDEKGNMVLDEFYTKVSNNTLYKIDLKAGTILTEEMLVEAEDLTTKDVREQEYNVIILPTYLEKNDYIDIRMRLPSGEDYIVVSKKKVIDTNETTIWMNMREEEILTLSNAIVEAYVILGAELYATTYIEPGIQEIATVTYVPSMSVIQLIENNPNIVQKAKDELKSRYNIETLINGRLNIINSALTSIDSDKAIDHISDGISASIEERKRTRKEYLQELESAAISVSTAGTTTTK